MLEYHERKAGPHGATSAGPLANLGRCLLAQGKGLEAEPLLRRCLTIRQRTQPDDWTTFNTMSLLGGSLLAQKRYDEAEPLVVDGYAGMNRHRAAPVPAPNAMRLAEASQRVVALYGGWGKADRAASWRVRLGLAVRELPAQVFAP